MISMIAFLFSLCKLAHSILIPPAPHQLLP
jgi:hypothetical protein